MFKIDEYVHDWSTVSVKSFLKYFTGSMSTSAHSPLNIGVTKLSDFLENDDTNLPNLSAFSGKDLKSMKTWRK